jgi:hypothetical protein
MNSEKKILELVISKCDTLIIMHVKLKPELQPFLLTTKEHWFRPTMQKLLNWNSFMIKYAKFREIQSAFLITLEIPS